MTFFRPPLLLDSHAWSPVRQLRWLRLSSSLRPLRLLR